MTKQAFIFQLKQRLSSLPETETRKSIAYYEEMIDDRMEDGMSEEDAVAALGSIDEIVQNIVCTFSLPTLVKAKVNENKKKHTTLWPWILLAVLGLPFWLPLLLTFAAVILVVYITIWVIVFSLFAAVFAIGITGLFLIIFGVYLCVIQNVPTGICCIGAGLCLMAVSVLSVFAVVWISKLCVRMTAAAARKIKSSFIRREHKS